MLHNPTLKKLSCLKVSVLSHRGKARLFLVYTFLHSFCWLMLFVLLFSNLLPVLLF